MSDITEKIKMLHLVRTLNGPPTQAIKAFNGLTWLTTTNLSTLSGARSMRRHLGGVLAALAEWGDTNGYGELIEVLLFKVDSRITELETAPKGEPVEIVPMGSEYLKEAIRKTVEYVGLDTLPAEPGWAWYDAIHNEDWFEDWLGTLTNRKQGY